MTSIRLDPVIIPNGLFGVIMIYLSGTTPQYFHDENIFGCMFNVKRKTGGQNQALYSGCKWMLDNGAFTGFDEKKWIDAIFSDEFMENRHNCIGVIIPDVVYDWDGTLDYFHKYHMVVNGVYKKALATQNGAVVNGVIDSRIPWDLFDVLFIGGDVFHKRNDGNILAREAKKRGKHVHVGRVNGGVRIIPKYYPWADSCDGTTFKHHPTQQITSITNGIEMVKGMDYQWRLI